MILLQLDLIALGVACLSIAFGLAELYAVVVLSRRVKSLVSRVELLEESTDYQQVRKILATYEARAIGFEKLYLDLLQREDAAAGSNGSSRYGM